jgi:pimeloyl-ACP methyl ester carboxylesterase
LPPEVVRERLDRVLRESELPPDQWLPAYMPGMFHETASPELLDHALSISTVHPVGLRVGLISFAEADLREALPRIDVPTLLLWGEGDQRSPLSIADEMHDRIPASTLVVLPGAGHVTNLEVPAAFNDVVRAFLHEHAA